MNSLSGQGFWELLLGWRFSHTVLKSRELFSCLKWDVILLIEAKLINSESDWHHTSRVVRKSSSSGAEPLRKHSAECSQGSLAHRRVLGLYANCGKNCLWLLKHLQSLMPRPLAAMVSVILPRISYAACPTGTPEVQLSCFCRHQLWSGLINTSLLLPYSLLALQEEEEAVSSVGREMESHLDLAAAVSTSAHNLASAWK